VKNSIKTKEKEKILWRDYCRLKVGGLVWVTWGLRFFGSHIMRPCKEPMESEASAPNVMDSRTLSNNLLCLSGAYYGIDGIPEKWLFGLSKADDIGFIIEKLI